MNSESLAVKATPCLLLLGLALGGSRVAVAQGGAAPSPENSPWIIAKIVNTVPFSFVYDGKASGELLPQWEQKQVKQVLPGDREHDITTYRDRRTGLEVTYEMTLYKKLQAVDWVVRLRNGGTADTPIIEDLRSVDLGVDVPGRGDVVLHQAGGGLASPGNFSAEDFLLKEDKVGPGQKFQ